LLSFYTTYAFHPRRVPVFKIRNLFIKFSVVSSEKFCVVISYFKNWHNPRDKLNSEMNAWVATARKDKETAAAKQTKTKTTVQKGADSKTGDGEAAEDPYTVVAYTPAVLDGMCFSYDLPAQPANPLGPCGHCKVMNHTKVCMGEVMDDGNDKILVCTGCLKMYFGGKDALS
jgi:hypothetical protein